VTRAAKLCTKCTQPKPLAEFGWHSGRRASACKACERERGVLYRICSSGISAKDAGGMTYAKIAKELKISRAGAQLIGPRAIKKLRKAAVELGVVDEDELRGAGGWR